METKTQTIAVVEMNFDKATKNKYVFAAPTGSALEAIYVSKLVYAKQPKTVRVTIEVVE
jgi:TolB-like protein